MQNPKDNSAVIIPIKVDAMLVKPGDGPVAESKVDFSRLPFNNGKEDVNSEFAFISENFLSQPFQNQNLYLEPGVHLHWALPDAITKGEMGSEKIHGQIKHLEAGLSDFKISGTVLGFYSDNILVGANIIIKGSNVGTTADFDGKFSLKVKVGDVLSVSCTDYITKEVTITVKETYIIRLIEISGPKYVNHSPVPDRWVINRKNKEGKVEKSWVVESNYLHPEGRNNNYHAIAYPIEVKDTGQPFRYMGRSYCFYDATKSNAQPAVPKLLAKAEYLKELTAVGYGEHTFAAFYPNCHSVFGFHDPEIKKETDLNLVNYEVLGWYSNPVSDPVQLIDQPQSDLTSGGLYFDGVNDAATCPDQELTRLTQKLTIEAWIKIEGKDNINTIVAKRKTGYDKPGYAFYVNKWQSSERNLVFETNAARAVTVASITPGIWHHVAVVVDGAVAMYIDGKIQGLASSDIELQPSDDNLTIGWFDPVIREFNFKGSIRDLRIWKIARTSAQINSWMNQPLNAPQGENDLVAYYKLNEVISESESTKLIDSSYSGNHGDFIGHPEMYIKRELKKQFNFDLKVAPGGSDQLGSLMSLCFGEIQFDINTNEDRNTEVKLAIGNTGTEALSALIAENIALNGLGLASLIVGNIAQNTNAAGSLDGPGLASLIVGNIAQNTNDKKLLEAKLEALQLLSKVAGKKLDIDAAFEEAYHEKGFSTVDGGHIWSLRLESVSDADQPNKGKKQGAEITLPESFAHWLNEVNLLQQQHDRALDELLSLRQLLYSDWCKYMMSAYHPDIEKGLPQMDEVRFFIENSSIPEVAQKEAQIQELQQQIDGELAQINQLVAQFNSGLAAFPKLLTEKYFIPGGKTPADGVRTDNTTSVTQKDPSLEGVFVNKFDETEAGETIVLPVDGSFNAISFWVNINKQKSYTGQLLKFVNPADTGLIDSNGVDAYWQSVYINGLAVDPYELTKWKNFPKDQWIHVYLRGASPVSVPKLVLMDGLKGSLAGVRVYHTGLTAMEVFCDQNMFLLKELKLVNDKGPRYWQPNEPVVLISGDIAEPTDRHGSDGELPCLLLEPGIDLPIMDDPRFFKPSKPKEEFNPEPFRKLLTTIKDLAGTINTKGTSFANFIDAYTSTQAYPKLWNPLILEWKVGINPLADGGGLSGYTLPEGFITDHYVLEDDKPDLIPHPENVHTPDSLKIFSGATILTPHAKTRLTKVIEQYLENLHEDSPDWNDFKGTKPPGLDGNPDPFVNPFVNAQGKADPSLFPSPVDPIATDDTISIALKAYNAMGKDAHFLSQSFGGFNAALQMLHQTFQLPIADPIGFDDDQAFAAKVRDKVQRASTHAPLPLFEFDPIRTGKMKLLELSIIDTFGQIEKVYDDDSESNKLSVVYSRTLDQGQFPPRIAQPARLNFRWLSAKDDDMEMNDHPVSSPVCGWLVPNNIDGTIMVYDQNGYSLGAIHPVAGETQAVTPQSKAIESPPILEEIPVAADLDFFESLKSSIRSGFDSFNVGDAYYFTYKLRDLIYLMSEEYNSAGARDNGIKSVEKNLQTIARYKRLQDNGEHYFVLRAGNNQEIARSRPFNSADDMEKIITELTGGPPVATYIKAPAHAHQGPVSHIASFNQYPNAHLKAVVDKISAMPDLPAFMDLLEKTMDEIDPENFAQHTDLAMLMGRPIAVVRASVGLELKGKPAVNQSWDAFMNDMTSFLHPDNKDKQATKRTTNDWETVKFPVRIGEHGQLNDGVLGYWLDDSTTDEFLSTVPADDADISPFLGSKTNSRGYDATRPNMTRSPADAPVQMTLLMDPRGKAHATCGILPAKQIALPDDQYKPALKNMSVTFFTRPLLMPMNKLAIPLPDETGYSWSWLEKRNGQWTEISTIGIVHKDRFTNTFKNGEDLWAELLKEGWIEETENDKARVMPQNHRKKPTSSLLITQLTKIQEILDAGHIVEESYEPDFSHTNRIKEGWLKLTPNQ